MVTLVCESLVKRRRTLKGCTLIDGEYRTTVRTLTLGKGRNGKYFRVVGNDFTCGFQVAEGRILHVDSDRIDFMGYGHSWSVVKN